MVRRTKVRETRAGVIKTPCRLVCRLEDNLCVGCGRSVDQIRNWSTYSDEQREQIISEISTTEPGNL